MTPNKILTHIECVEMNWAIVIGGGFLLGCASLPQPTVLEENVVSNRLFSVSLPPTIVVETNNRDTILASGGLEPGATGAGFAAPVFIIYFCAFDSNAADVTRCDDRLAEPLTTEAFDKIRPPQLPWDRTISTRKRDGDVMEWSACAAGVEKGQDAVVCNRRLRGAKGYIDLRYLDAKPREAGEQLMESVTGSIRWR